MVISLTSCMGFNRNGSPGEKGGERLKIYTKTGDAGETGLFGGGRTSKDSPRVAAYGEVDELNAALGLARALGTEQFADSLLETVQRDLFTIGAELATPDAPTSSGDDPRRHRGAAQRLVRHSHRPRPVRGAARPGASRLPRRPVCGDHRLGRRDAVRREARGTMPRRHGARGVVCVSRRRGEQDAG